MSKQMKNISKNERMTEILEGDTQVSVERRCTRKLNWETAGLFLYRILSFRVDRFL